MTKPHVLIVSYHFYPSTAVGAKRPSELAKYLGKEGCKVSVICASGRDNSGDSFYDVPDGIDVHSIQVPRKRLSAVWRWAKGAGSGSRETGNVGPLGDRMVPSSKSSLLRRVAAWPRLQLRAWNSFVHGDKAWLVRCAIQILRIRRRQSIDVVIASGPPIAGYLAAVLASRRFQAPLILDFRDPWYLNADIRKDSPLGGHFLMRAEDAMGQWCISNSARIVVASPGSTRATENAYELSGQPIDVVRNGYDPSSICTAPTPVGRLDMLYAGSLYLNRNPFPFLESLAEFLNDSDIDRSKIVLTLVGDCRAWKGRKLGPWLESNNLSENVRIRDRVDPDELSRMVERSNVLVNFAQGQPLQTPAKSYEYLVSGRDLLVITESDSDVARLHSDANLGVVVAPADNTAMQSALRGLYDHYVIQRKEFCSRGASVERFSRAKQLQDYFQIIGEVVNDSVD
jgi:glycosyltransferase involved in cell wall biosynthesis